MNRLNLKGTDNGPPCWRCSGTIWAYFQVQDGYPEATRKWHAECCGCHVPEGPIDAGGSDASAVEISKAHETFLQGMKP